MVTAASVLIMFFLFISVVSFDMVIYRIPWFTAIYYLYVSVMSNARYMLLMTFLLSLGSALYIDYRRYLAKRSRSEAKPTHEH